MDFLETFKSLFSAIGTLLTEPQGCFSVCGMRYASVSINITSSLSIYIMKKRKYVLLIQNWYVSSHSEAFFEIFMLQKASKSGIVL